ncbi:MAG TPA: hypothetical protein VFC39_14650 [Acidobacteriaceae bacterium]|nr:hypothetical protein [Acidobacteriaceae bacterium]
MTNVEGDGGGMKDDLVQRIALMETMIAEGRRSTMRYAWVFILWGLVDLAAMAWRSFQPRSEWVGLWAWPVCLVVGALLTIAGLALRRRECGAVVSMECRSVEAVWGMMGISLAVFVAAGMAQRLTWQLSYCAALLVIVGMAHAISAKILRWRVQGAVAVVWWAGGVAMFYARTFGQVNAIMFVEMVLGMIVFGLYAMGLERRDDHV